MKENQLREELQLVLEYEPNNYSKILELSMQLSAFDAENVRFSVDAGVIDRLGSELIAKQETAVSELVKNCYDADATKVDIIFENSDAIGGTLYIQDNGCGMTREQLINNFMRISTSSKIHNPLSEKFQRKKAGQKGIGRFAVQRLGEKLTIITQTENNPNAIELTIDWNDYNRDINLLSINNRVKELDGKKQIHGTLLKIALLKDKWSEASIRRIYKYVSDILQPFSLSDENIHTSTFKVNFAKKVDNKTINIANDKLMVYEHAVAEIEGAVDANGMAIYSVKSKKLNINEVGELSSDPEDDSQLKPFTELKDVKFRAYYYIYNSDLISKQVSTAIQTLARTQGGIRLYRNGFRVLPYGEPANDWLRLDASVRQRSILPIHGNHNFFGFIELNDPENKFNETSSREGLIENNAFIELQNFVYRTLLTGVAKVAAIRNIKTFTSQKKNDKGIYEAIDIKIKNIAFTIEELDKQWEEESSSIGTIKKRTKKVIKNLKQEIQELKELQEQEQALYLKEKAMLRVLSSVGLTIALFIHEVKDYLINMNLDTNFLLEKLKNDEVIFNRLLLLKSNVSSFSTYTSYFDAVISQNVVRELEPIELQNAIEDFWKICSSDIERNNIIFEKPVRIAYDLFTVPMHPSEWSSILFNLYTNAKKAIKRTNNKGIIHIECGTIDNNLFLRFSDTGDGIKEENKERIFDEFFTTSSPYSLDDSELIRETTGTGLGLKIVKDIVSSYRGKIYVDNPKEGFSTTIYIEIPKANQKILEKYGY